MCRVCHASAPVDSACDWLVCSVVGCCAGYAVCAACASALDAADASGDRCEDFPLEVRALHAALRLLLHASCLDAVGAAGSECAVPAVAADDVRRPDRALHCGASVPDVHQAKDEPQPRQRCAGAVAQRAHAQ